MDKKWQGMGDFMNWNIHTLIDVEKMVAKLHPIET
jgi:hypothetical protein